MSELAIRAGLDGSMLVTRPHGARFRPVLEAVLSETASSTLLIDFAEIALIDGSFADEVFGDLAARRGRRQFPWPCVGLCHLNAASRDNIEMALLTRPIHDRGLRNCVLPIVGPGREVVLLGKAEAHVQDTFAALQDLRVMTARALADSVGLDIRAASTRLRTVFDLGIATRREVRDAQGKEFEYAWPF